MENKEITLQLKNINKTFVMQRHLNRTIREKVLNFFQPNDKQNFQALKNVNLEVRKGECLGILGRNGSGKSTLVKIMSGSFLPDKGSQVYRKGSSLLLNLGVGFSHELTARDNIYVNGLTLGLRIPEIDKIFDTIIEFAEIENFVDTKIKYFSSGMVQRLSFSIAIYAKAEILFLDEIFAVGDYKFQQKATKLLEEHWLKDRTVVLVSHSNEILLKYCTRAILMVDGEVAFCGDPYKAVEKYESIV